MTSPVLSLPMAFLQTIGLSHFLVVGAILFCAGITTVLARRNAVGILIGLELILNAANLNLVAFERFGPAPLRGTVFAIFVLAVAAAEAAIGLAIALTVFDSRDEIDVDETTALKG